MKTTIEVKSYKTKDVLVVEIGEDQWGDNVVISKTLCGMTKEDPPPVSISFPLDAEAARALSFALGELAKNIRSQ